MALQVAWLVVNGDLPSVKELSMQPYSRSAGPFISEALIQNGRAHPIPQTEGVSQ